CRAKRSNILRPSAQSTTANPFPPSAHFRTLIVSGGICMGLLKGYTKQEISWMMYDWANSAHSVIVVTLLPIFFDSVAANTADSVSSLSTWGYATSIAMAIVAIAAPFLGVFGDIRGMRKKLFTFFLLLGVVAVARLSFTPLMDFTSSTSAAGQVAGLILVLY